MQPFSRHVGPMVGKQLWLVSRHTCGGVLGVGIVDLPVGCLGAICHPGGFRFTGQGGLHPNEAIAVGVLWALLHSLCMHLRDNAVRQEMTDSGDADLLSCLHFVSFLPTQLPECTSQQLDWSQNLTQSTPMNPLNCFAARTVCINSCQRFACTAMPCPAMPCHALQMYGSVDIHVHACELLDIGFRRKTADREKSSTASSHA